MGGGGGIGAIVGGVLGVALSPFTGGVSLALSAAAGSALGNAAGQEITTGGVDWGQVGMAGAMSLAGSAIGAGVGGAFGDAAGEVNLNPTVSTGDVNLGSSGWASNMASQDVLGTTGASLGAEAGGLGGELASSAEVMSAQTTPKFYMDNYGMTYDQATDAAMKAATEKGVFRSDIVGSAYTGDRPLTVMDFTGKGLTFEQAGQAVKNGLNPAALNDAALDQGGLGSFWNKAVDEATTKANLTKLGMAGVKAVLTPAQQQNGTAGYIAPGAVSPTASVNIPGITSPISQVSSGAQSGDGGVQSAQPILSVAQVNGGAVGQPSIMGGGGVPSRSVAPMQFGLGGTLRAPNLAAGPNTGQPWFQSAPGFLQQLYAQDLGQYYDDSNGSLGMFLTQKAR